MSDQKNNNELNNEFLPFFSYDQAKNAFFTIIQMHSNPVIENIDDENDIFNYNNEMSLKNRGNHVNYIFPTRRSVGKRIFDPIPREHVVEFYLNAVSLIPLFKERNPLLKNWSIKNDIGLENIFIQSFFLWVLNNRKGTNQERFSKEFQKNRFNHEKIDINDNGIKDANFNNFFDCAMNISNNLNNGSLDSSSIYSTKSCESFVISKESKLKIIRQLIPIRFSLTQNIWNLALDALSFSHESKLFCEEVIKASEKGDVSFATLNYCFSTPRISKHFNQPEIVIQGLLLGPLKGAVVESFAEQFNDNFRKKLKKLLLKAEKWTNSAAYEAALETFAKTSMSDPNVPSLAEYTNNVKHLMIELRKENIKNNTIGWKRAHYAVKMGTRRHYIEKTWQTEHLDDLLHTIIVQRPAIKSSVIKLLKHVYNDHETAMRWSQFNPFNLKYTLPANYEKIDFHEKIPGYLSIPKEVQVYVVDTEKKIIFLENELSLCESSNFPVVGLDSEWSPYVTQSRASVLQIAFEKSVYLVDLDTLRIHKRLVTFLDRLFLSEKVLKIGFQFADDLFQLRECMRSCFALYHPENLICLGKLIDLLLARSRVKGDFNLQKYFSFCADEHAEWIIARTKSNNLENGLLTNAQKNLNDSYGVLSSDNNDENVLLKKEEQIFDLSLNLDDLEDHKNTDYSMDNAKVAGSKTFEKTKKVEKKLKIAKNMGLSNVCQRMLGVSLDKTEQCSVWNRRPLRPKQIRYAALDAYCIIELYKRCKKWSEELNLNIRDLELAQDKMQANFPLFWEPLYNQKR